MHVIQCLSFCVLFISLSTLPPKADSIPSHLSSTFCLSIHLSADTWVADSLGSCEQCLCEQKCACLDVSKLINWKYCKLNIYLIHHLQKVSKCALNTHIRLQSDSTLQQKAYFTRECCLSDVTYRILYWMWKAEWLCGSFSHHGEVEPF